MALSGKAEPTRVLTAGPEAAGRRLDVFLSENLPLVTRTRVSRLIAEGRVVVAGREVKAGLALKAGDRIRVELPPPAPSEVQPEDLPLTVVYHDEALAVVDKPAGLVTHPAAGHRNGTLVNALLHHLDRLSGIGGVERPGLVHRLDKETSGLLVVAKTDLAHRALSRDLQERRLHREYQAVVWGRLATAPWVLSTRIARDARDRKRFVAAGSGGKEAVTHGQAVQVLKDVTWLILTLDTGRTHQIRVHCRHLGHPVVGDRTYGLGGETARLTRLGLVRPGRQLLHAARLTLTHPDTGTAMEFRSPLPDDFRLFLASAGADPALLAKT